MQPPVSPGIFSIGYKGPPRGSDFERWREDICRLVIGLDVKPGEGDVIDCRMGISLLADIAIVTPAGTTARLARTRELLADGSDSLALMIATKGSLLLSENGRPIQLSQSQMCLMDHGVVGSALLGNGNDFTAIKLPRAELLAVFPKAEAKLFQVLGGQKLLRTMIARYAAVAADLAPEVDRIGQQLMARQIIDLIGLLLRPEADRAEPAGAESYAVARLDLMRADVLTNLVQTDLDLGRIAHKYGVSLRQAQRLFEQAGTTFTDFLLEHRLLRARKLLLAPANRQRKISDIAHHCGFSHISYFNRAFRKRFGVAPSDLRGADASATVTQET